MKVYVPCPVCHGQMVELQVASPRLAGTLRLLRATGETTATALHAAMPCPPGTVTAINNRLAELYRLGFAARRREGRAWAYSATELTFAGREAAGERGG